MNNRKNELETKISSQKLLDLSESDEYLKLGNDEFMLELSKYSSHHQKPDGMNEYDVAVITCADARCDSSLFRDFVDNRILFVQVAGNVIDFNDSQTRIKIESAIAKVKQGGTLINMGHSKCGAVDANSHANHYVGKVSRHVDFLVGLVDRKHSTVMADDDYKANAINQAARLTMHPIVIEKGAHVVPCLFDFTNGEAKAISYLKEGSEPGVLTNLRASGITHLKYANENSYNLQAQYAHAIVVSDPVNLGRFSNARTTFNGRLNELFCVSANDNEISSDGIASIEYALLKVNGVKDAPHVVILHTNIETAKKLKDKMLNASDIIKEKTKNGELISTYLYNKNTGEAKHERT